MNLQPLLDAAPVIRVHAVLALSAFALGAAQLALPKGSTRHRMTGYLWVGLMVVIAVSSFWIKQLRPGSFSFVHIVAAATLVSLPLAVLHARRGRIRRHGIAMASLFLGAMIIAGGFTLLPHRIMGRVVFGALDVPMGRCA